MHATSDLVSQHWTAAQAAAAFRNRFGGQPRIFAAPGRINIIGEHTDYSEGLTMPAAIDRVCLTAIAQNGLGRLRVRSVNRDGEADIGEDFVRRNDWTDYVSGVRAALAGEGIAVPGCDLLIASNVPEGAGVSSSAALEVSVMAAMLSVAEVSAAPVDIARWSQIAETQYVGMPCGIMDQFVAANGLAGHALVLDCRTLSFDAAPLPVGAAFMVIDSQIRHKLTDGGYAARRADCEMAAKLLGVTALRDATEAMLRSKILPERILRRARHVVAENKRVVETAAALSSGSLPIVGELMNASHHSLRDDFDVTCEETDMLASIAAATPGIHGARQMGGGFGGTVLALADRSALMDASQSIVAAYGAATGLETSAFTCVVSGGVRELLE